MFCGKCGRSVPDGGRFCAFCGAEVAVGSVCPACGQTATPGMIYCNHCGQLLTAGAPEPVPDPPPRPAPAPTPAPRSAPAPAPVKPSPSGSLRPQGSLLRSMKMVSLYEGTPTVGIAKASGDLFIYDDRIEFKKKFGNAAAGMLGVAGLLAAGKKAQDETFPVGEVAGLQVGKYGGVYNTLVVVTKAGRTVSFCPGMPGSRAPGEIIEQLKKYTGW